jgi:hypothetical protein
MMFDRENNEYAPVKYAFPINKTMIACGILFLGIASLVIASVYCNKYYNEKRAEVDKQKLLQAQVAMDAHNKLVHDATMKQENDKYFTRVSIADDKPRLEFYYQDNCMACISFKTIWKEFVDKHPVNKFIAIDPMDASKVDLTDTGITRVPTIAYRERKTAPMIKYTGPMDQKTLYTWVKLQLKTSKLTASNLIVTKPTATGSIV